ALDLSVRMPESGPAEIGALERAFNAMASSLQSSRDDLRDLLEEQAALRRVATLVARAVPPQEVFCAVVSEVCDLLGADATSLLSYEPDGTATVVANRHPRADVNLPVGARLNLAGDNVTGAVLQTGRPARMDSYDRAPGLLAARMRAIGVRAAAGTPIVVDGQLWGTIAAFTRTAFPPGVECRLAGFTELVAAAIANAESRAELAASRARVIAAADQTRRLIERDLHDGIQQRLVSLALEIRAAGMMVAPDHDELRMQLSGVSRGLAGAMDDLREISRGIHPAILSTDGLPPALKTLARRSVVPVRLSVGLDERLPDGHEVALYYVVSEALTNAAKHAQASVVHVDLRLDGDAVHLSITDDGVGGADPSAGSGLVGLKDRIGALGGRIDIASPPGGGTTLLITVPLPARQPSRAG
ncbi:MAG TPA: GAF domain-containing protein, partial [Acidimicrobiia bacterium]